MGETLDSPPFPLHAAAALPFVQCNDCKLFDRQSVTQKPYCAACLPHHLPVFTLPARACAGSLLLPVCQTKYERLSDIPDVPFWDQPVREGSLVGYVSVCRHFSAFAFLPFWPRRLLVTLMSCRPPRSFLGGPGKAVIGILFCALNWVSFGGLLSGGSRVPTVFKGL